MIKKLVFLIFIFIFGITGCSKKPIQLTVEIFDRGIYENAWTRWVQEKVHTDLNIDVSFVSAKGNAPDLCYTYDEDMVNKLRDEGSIINLAPYIDKYLPDLKKLLGDDPAFPGKNFIYRNMDPETGHIYSISSYRVALAKDNVFIRKDWLDKLGLAVPKTPEEFDKALAAFRDFDPGKVGKNNVIPFGEIVTTADELYDKIKSGVVGAFCQKWDLPYDQEYKILEELQANVPGANLIPVDCFENKELMDKADKQIFIFKSAKNTHIAALRYLNWLAKPENYGFLQIGMEGVNHYLADGIPVIQKRPEGDEWFQYSPYNSDIVILINGLELGDAEMNARALALSYGEISAEVIIEAYAVSVRNALRRDLRSGTAAQRR